MRANLKYTFSILLLLSIGLLTFMIGLKSGSFNTDWTSVYHSFFMYDSSDAEHFVIRELRIPRIIGALLVGGLLSISGYLMQAMTNNPLADPYLLGTSSGAGFGAGLAYSGFIPLSIISTSLLSFAGACIVTLTALAISYYKGRIEPARLLLTGVALSSLMVSATGLVMFFSGEESKLKNIIFWTLGGFEQVSKEQLYLPLVIFILLVVLFSFYQKQLNLLLLGEERAQNLGMKIKPFRFTILIACSLATGIAVSISGPIGFVGLIIPHFIRSHFGVTGKFNLLFTALWGGVFMMICETAARLVFLNMAIPVGIVTSFIGIPFFIYLIGRNRYKF